MSAARFLTATMVIAISTLACAKKEPAEPAASVSATQPAPAAPAGDPTPVNTPPAASPAPAAAPAGIATADAETPGVTAVVTELKRTSGGALSLKFTIVNASDKEHDFGYNYGESSRTGDYGSIGGVHLIDEAGKKKYFVIRDSEGNCVCSRGLKGLPQGKSANLWARFPAPPEDVQKISIVIPHFSPLDDVPISR
ncbi:MAG TPA: hypothetical protein VFL80_02835 [Thermoanaerobaculia bacterium]|nr:hypothetical protein [Thermoanaerobaculia bacterium]